MSTPPSNGAPSTLGRDAADASAPRRAKIGGFRLAPVKRSRAGLLAVVAHLALGIFLLRAITFDTRFQNLFSWDNAEVVEERVVFVETALPAPPQATPTTPPVARREMAVTQPAESRGPVLGDGGVVAQGAPRLVAPSLDSAATRLTAAEAAVVGVVPRADSRLWSVADLVALRNQVIAAAARADGSGLLAGARELDSVITYTLLSARDSLDSLAVVQAMGPLTANWTKKDGQGGTWGMDAAGIRLGKVTIPSALLGLLPLGAQQYLSGNPTAIDRQRRLALAQSDIARFRTSGPGNDQFKMLVQELRERRDRERAERRSQVAPTKNGPVANPTGPPLPY